MRRRNLLVLLLLSLAVLLPVASFAWQSDASVDPSYLQLLRWRMVGPSRGGRVTAVAGDPVNKLVFYFGATGGGVWKTEDGGIGGRGRGGAVESQYRLRGNGRGLCARRRFLRRRRL